MVTTFFSSGIWLQGLISTSFLTPLADGVVYKVPMYVRHSSLRLPYRPINPVIMVGPGTGVAPFRGFIQDRASAHDEGECLVPPHYFIPPHCVDNTGKKLGETVLYFGCRKKSEDFIYEEELNQYLANGVLSSLYVAFSREQVSVCVCVLY